MRSRVESGLRFAAFAALAWLLWGAWAEPRRAPVAAVRSGNLGVRLAEWSVRPGADTLVIVVERAISPVHREWLAALRQTGVAVAWSGHFTPLAMEAEPVSDPAGGLVVRAAASAGERLRLNDALGALDSASVVLAGTAFGVPAATGGLQVEANGHAASAAVPEPAAPRRVVVYGRAGWEARFVVMALEERGYEVDARMGVGPSVWVTQGRPVPLDTARHGAVVVLDTSAMDRAREIVGFVRRGGGAILAAEVVAGPLSAVAPGGTGTRLRPVTFAVETEAPRLALPLVPVEPLDPLAVPLEWREGSVAVAARRVGSGRVIQVGYQETWRWRMGGSEGAPDTHREWWAGLVAAAAYRPLRPVAPVAADPAPLAALVDALGPATSAPAVPSRRWPPVYPWVLGFLVAALLGEWASRRLRGAV